MATGSLVVEMELVDDKFVTRVTRSGDALRGLEQRILSTVTATNRLDSAFSGSAGSIAAWTIAIGEAGNAVHNLETVFGSWIERIVETNSELQRTGLLLEGLSRRATVAERQQEAQAGLKQVIDMAGQTPFGLPALTDTFVKIKTAGIDPLAGSLHSLTDAIAAFGGNDQRLERAGYAIQEMAGRGVISLQNLRRQLGQDIPGAVEMMASGMNVTIGQLDQMVTKGTLASLAAVQLMFDEFDRRFGGASLRLMQTFTGQVSQLTTSLTKLAVVAGGEAQQAVDGLQQTLAQKAANGSFYSSLLQDMHELNTYLNSPAMTANAVSLDMALKNLLDDGAGVARVMIAWQGPLKIALELFLALGTAAVIVKTIEGAVGILGGTFVTLAAGAGSLIGTLRGLPGMVSGAFSVATTAVSGWSNALLASVTGMAEAEIAATGLAGVMAGLTTGFAIIAIPTAIIVGAAAIAMALGHVTDQANLTSEALKRIRLGDVSDPTVQSGKKYLDDLQTRLQDAEAMLKRVQDMQAGHGSVVPRPFGGAEGVQGVDVPTNIGIFNFSGQKAAIDTYANQLVEYIRQLAGKIEGVSATLSGAAASAGQKNAQAYVDGMMQKLQSGIENFENVYAQAEMQLEKKRETQDPKDTAGVAALDKQHYQITKELYDNELNLIKQQQNAELQAALDAQSRGNSAEQLNHQEALRSLKAYLGQRQQETTAALAREGNYQIEGQTQKDFTKQTAELKTLMEGMTARAAQLRAELEGSVGGVEKLQAAFTQGGKFFALDPNAQNSKDAIAMQGELDKLTEAVKRLKKETEAGNKIDLGLEKATADLAAYTARVEDPNLTEAQRSFVQFERSMADALKEFMAALQGAGSGVLGFYGILTQGEAVMDRFAKAASAIQTEAAASALKGVGTLVEQAHNQMVSSMPAAARAAAQLTDNLNKLKDARTALTNAHSAGTISDQQFAQNMQALDNAQGDFTTSAGNREAKAGGHRDAGASEVDTLRGRIAQLQDEVKGVNGEYDKWMAKLNDPKSPYAKHAAEILPLVKELGNLEDGLKKVHAARTALDALKADNTKAQEEAQLAMQELADSGKELAIQRELINLRASTDKKINTISEQQPIAGALTADQIAKQVAQAHAYAEQQMVATTDKGVAEMLAADRTQTLEIKKNINDTLEARRQAGIKEIQEEEDKARAIIEKTNWLGQQKEQAEQTVTDWIKAKRDQLDKQTEDQLTKMARDWGDYATKIDDFGGQALTKLTDAITTTGQNGQKAFTDLANWAIQELERIALQAALSPLLKELGGSSSSGGAGGIGGILGSFFGGSSSSNPWDTAGGSGASTGGGGWLSGIGNWIGGLFGGGAAKTPTFHSGGIVGGGPHAQFHEASFYKLVSHHIMRHAPKFHTGGLAGGEVPAVLKSGEGVFTQGQMAAIGELNHNYGMMSQAVQSLAAVAVPNIAPSSYGMNGGAYGPAATMPNSTAGNAPPVTVNMHNQTGMNLSTMASQPKFDGEQIILDTVIKHATQPGRLRSALSGVSTN